MFATLIIGLREGLEAALIVGIIAAFLRRQGRTDALRWMWAGIAMAVTICVAVAVVLEVASHDLPQRQQEGLETVIGAVAVAMVTYMIVWMRDHARDMKGQLESAAADAVHRGSMMALVAMAFLAVLREGLETAVFLVAAFSASGNAATASTGAVIGIVIAVVLGYALYRGGVRINLARFFTVTGLVLVLVAAGLVMTALRTAHEAGWLNIGQQQALDLGWLVRPGSLQSSLVTGVLGIQPKPVLIEVLSWLMYVIVVGAVVLWPQRLRFPWRVVGYASLVVALVLGVSAAGVYGASADQPDQHAVRRLDMSGHSSVDRAGLFAGSGRLDPPDPVWIETRPGTRGTLRVRDDVVEMSAMRRVGTTDVAGRPADTYQQVVSPTVDIHQVNPGAPTRVTIPEIIAANGGRLPVGIKTSTFGDRAPVIYAMTATVTVDVDPSTHWPLDSAVDLVITATATPRHGSATVLGKVATIGYRGGVTSEGMARIDATKRQIADHHRQGVVVPIVIAVVAALAALLGTITLMIDRRRRRAHQPAPDAVPADLEISDPEISETGVDDPANIEEKTR